MTVVFYRFNKIATKKFAAVSDPATGEKLTEKNKKFEIKKVVELPWVFWCIMLFSFFQTSTAIVFTQNATELAEQRFGTDSVTAGWYSATLQYAGMFEVIVNVLPGDQLVDTKQASFLYHLLAFSSICMEIVFH